MKKSSRILLLFLAGIYAFSGTAFGQVAQEQEGANDYAPAVFSFCHAKELKDQFIFWLGKHYRCLYGGKCTRAEKKEVIAEWKRWTKFLGIGTVIAWLSYSVPKGAQKLRSAVHKEVIDLSQSATQAAVTKAIDTLKENQEELGDLYANIATSTVNILVNTILSAIDSGALVQDDDPQGVLLSVDERKKRISALVHQTVRDCFNIPAEDEIDPTGLAADFIKQILAQVGTWEFQMGGIKGKLVKQPEAQQPSQPRHAGASAEPKNSFLDNIFKPKPSSSPKQAVK